MLGAEDICRGKTINRGLCNVRWKRSVDESEAREVRSLVKSTNYERSSGIRGEIVERMAALKL